MNRRSFFTRLGQVAVGAALLKFLPTIPVLDVPAIDVQLGSGEIVVFPHDRITVSKHGTYYVYADNCWSSPTTYKATRDVSEIFGSGRFYRGRFNTVTP